MGECMAKRIGALEARTHFSQIIEQAEQGEDFVITRRGRPVAKIVPFIQAPKMTRQEAFAQLMEMRRHCKGTGSLNNFG